MLQELLFIVSSWYIIEPYFNVLPNWIYRCTFLSETRHWSSLLRNMSNTIRNDWQRATSSCSFTRKQHNLTDLALTNAKENEWSMAAKQETENEINKSHKVQLVGWLCDFITLPREFIYSNESFDSFLAEKLTDS